MTFWNVVSAAAAIVAIATVAGLALQRGYTVALRDNLTLARETTEVQRKEIEKLKTDLSEAKVTIAAQANDIRVLQGVVTGEVQLQVIHQTLDTHHEAAEEHWDRTTGVLQEILAAIRGAA
jgi:hypothetical protein